MKFYEHLENIQKRPLLYIYKENLSNLVSYLNGYMLCIQNFDINLEEEPNFDLFHDYIAMKYGYSNKGGAGWSTILEKKYKDGKEALDKFFVHFDDFRRELKGKNKEEIISYFKDKDYDLEYRL